MGEERYTHAVRIQRIRELLENQRYVTVRELMEKFCVCRKTVYNDRDALIQAGVPLHCEVVEGEARWWLAPEVKKKTITLTLAEGQVLPLGLAQLALKFLAGTIIYDQLEAIHEKLTIGVTPRTRKQLEEMTRKITIVPHGPKLYREKVEVLDDLLEGLVHNKRLLIQYRSPERPTPKAHLIEPLTLALYREALYLVAYSQQAARRLSFAVDRIVETEVRNDERFEYPADYDPGDHFGGAFGLLGGEPATIELVFDKEQARYVKERHWHRTQAFETLADGRVRMTMQVSGLEDVQLWLLGHAGTFEVLAPAALREAVRAKLENGLKKHARRRGR